MLNVRFGLETDLAKSGHDALRHEMHGPRRIYSTQV